MEDTSLFVGYRNVHATENTVTVQGKGIVHKDNVEKVLLCEEQISLFENTGLFRIDVGEAFERSH
jgi:hypothetical protein